MHVFELTKKKLTLLEEVKKGLSKPQKELPCKFLYDKKGSVLFDKICQLEEYYPTRTENAIMQNYVKEMADYIGEKTLLIEYGSGSSIKIRSLLNVLKNPAGYIPVDISKEHLNQSVSVLKKIYPHILIHPIHADYTQSFSLPYLKNTKKRVVYFPGSTIGNFHPQESVEFLSRVAKFCMQGGGVLIGVDLKKENSLLNAAYDDKEGMTAKFNKNILDHLNSRFDSNINLDNFKHMAFFNEEKGRIEMHLVSRKKLSFDIDEMSFSMKKGESIWTESSYKYTIDEFESMARQSGLMVEQVWTDSKHLFSVQYLSVA